MLKNFYLNAPHLCNSKVVVEIIQQYMTYIFFIKKKKLCIPSVSQVKLWVLRRHGYVLWARHKNSLCLQDFWRKLIFFTPKIRLKKNLPSERGAVFCSSSPVGTLDHCELVMTIAKIMLCRCWLHSVVTRFFTF